MKYLLIFSIIFTSFSAFTQNSEWKLLESKNGVNVYSKLNRCIVPTDAMDSDYYLFKLENTTTAPLKIEWKIDKWYDGKCYTCNNEYKVHSYELPANSSVEAECGRNKTESLKVYVKHNNFNTGTKFTKFQLSDFQVKSIL